MTRKSAATATTTCRKCLAPTTSDGSCVFCKIEKRYRLETVAFWFAAAAWSVFAITSASFVACMLTATANTMLDMYWTPPQWWTTWALAHCFSLAVFGLLWFVGRVIEDNNY